MAAFPVTVTDCWLPEPLINPNFLFQDTINDSTLDANLSSPYHVQARAAAVQSIAPIARIANSAVRTPPLLSGAAAGEGAKRRYPGDVHLFENSETCHD